MRRPNVSLMSLNNDVTHCFDRCLGFECGVRILLHLPEPGRRLRPKVPVFPTKTE